MTVKELKEAIGNLPDNTIVRCGIHNGTRPAKHVYYNPSKPRVDIIDATDREHRKIYREYGFQRVN